MAKAMAAQESDVHKKNQAYFLRCARRALNKPYRAGCVRTHLFIGSASGVTFVRTHYKLAHMMKKAALHLRILLGLFVFSMAGNILRIKLERPSAVGNPFLDFIPNLLGCFLIGVMFQLKDRVFEVKFPGCSTFKDWGGASSLYVGVATWFCGSLTTYSAWNTVVTQRLLTGPFLWGASVAFLGASTAYIALLFGMDLASGFSRVGKPSQPLPPTRTHEGGSMQVQLEDGVRGPTHTTSNRGYSLGAVRSPPAGPGGWASSVGPQWFRDPVAQDLLLYSLLCVPLIVVLAHLDGVELWSCLLAPWGAGLRWALSLAAARLPKREGWSVDLPVHTWAANFLGSLLSAAFRVGMLEAQAGGHSRAETAFHALSVGLCGCLSTYSTLSLEVFRLPSTRSAYHYMAATFLASQAASLLILGLYQAKG